MIPKIICFIFGHVRREKAVTDISGSIRTYYWEYQDYCPRCGKELSTSKQHEE